MVIPKGRTRGRTKTRTKGGSRALANVRKFFPNVETVTDGPDDLEIEVTKADVSRARKADHNGCAMAVACARAMRADGMVVSIATAYVVKGAVAVRYRVPPSVGREITAFDRGATFAPGRYMLKAPDASMALGTPRQSRQHPQYGDGSDAARRAPQHLTDEIRATLAGPARRPPLAIAG